MKPSKRFCVVCEKMNSFKIDKTIHHSRCVECGAGFARRNEPLQKKFDQKIVSFAENYLKKAYPKHYNNPKRFSTSQVKSIFITALMMKTPNPEDFFTKQELEHFKSLNEYIEKKIDHFTGQ